MKLRMALMFCVGLVGANAATITYSTISASGSTNGVNYVFTGTSGTVVTLADYSLVTIPLGTLGITLDEGFQFPATANISIADVVNGVPGTIPLTLDISDFVGGFYSSVVDLGINLHIPNVFFVPQRIGAETNGTLVTLAPIAHDVPEPGTAVFALVGLGSLIAVRQYRRMRSL